MSVKTKVLAIVDRVAKGQQNALSNWSSGTDFWDLVDGAADETYENAVKGSTMTEVDAVLAASTVWSHSTLRKLFELHSAYFVSLGYTTGWKGYLAAIASQVPYEAAEALIQALGSSSALSTYQVFPKGTKPADTVDPSTTSGMHKFGRVTGTGAAAGFVSTDGDISSSKMIGAGILAINVDATPGASSLVIRTQNQSGANKDITLTPAGNTQYQQTILGAQALGSSASAGQPTVLLSATGQFTDEEYVFIYESDSLQEYAQVDSLSANTSLTFKSNLVNAYTTSAKVIPLLFNPTYLSGSMTNGKRIDLYALPGRTIGL